MQFSPLLSSPLLILASLLPGQAQTPRAWDPLFDYSKLPASNEAFWTPLQALNVQLENALEFAHKSEGDFQVINAGLRVDGAEGPFWNIELFVPGKVKPKRVDLQVSGNELKILKRIELLTLAADDEATWAVLSNAGVTLEQAIVLARQALHGEKEAAIVADGRARVAKFLPVAAQPQWDIEMMGVEAVKDQVRRYQVLVDSSKPQVKRKVMLDRFPGEPLRKGKATELPNGLVIYDFKEGDGETVKAESKVTVNYRLFLLDGQKTYDTWATKLPETFDVAKAPLKGLTAGLPGMRVGGRRKIAIPYAMAFGEQPNPLAPAKAMVVCDIAIEQVVAE